LLGQGLGSVVQVAYMFSGIKKWFLEGFLLVLARLLALAYVRCW